MKVFVVGAGSQGVPAAYAFDRLGYEVKISDPKTEALDKAMEKFVALEAVNIEVVDGLFGNYTDVFTKFKPDVVFSAAPFFANEKAAEAAFAAGSRYADLGGNPATSYGIQGMAKAAKLTAFTDLGLAPGLVNILGEELFRRSEETVTDMKLMCGGLPVNPTGYLKYGRTWSTEGLRNEYSGMCEVLRNGQMEHVQALTELEEVAHDFGIGALEAFPTKGGLASSLESLQSKGVVNAEYKTMRFPGHCDALRFLIEECKLNEEEFDKAIANATPEIHDDQVLMMVSVNGETHGWKVLHDENWTAMQKATAFPAASVAALVASGEFDHKIIPTYGDIPFDKMQANLDKIGDFPNLL